MYFFQRSINLQSSEKVQNFRKGGLKILGKEADNGRGYLKNWETSYITLYF